MYLRTTMTEKRLSSLAMIKIHRDIVADLDFDKLIVNFANKHPKRMALPCIFSEWLHFSSLLSVIRSGVIICAHVDVTMCENYYVLQVYTWFISNGCGHKKIFAYFAHEPPFLKSWIHLWCEWVCECVCFQEYGFTWVLQRLYGFGPHTLLSPEWEYM